MKSEPPVYNLFDRDARGLIDLDDNAMDIVLRCLPLLDLCRLAQTCMWLRIAVLTEFSRRSAWRRVYLSLLNVVAEDQHEEDSNMTVYGSSVLFVLRCFGDRIRSLSLNLKNSSRHQERVMAEYLRTYCHGTLTFFFL